MKKLELEKMSIIEGGNRSGCIDGLIGIGVAVGSTFLGPAGILSGAAGFLTFVNHAADCEAYFFS